MLEEGTGSSFLGVAETIRARGLFCSLYTDRASHYWTTPEAGGKVDTENPTQFGRALTRDLGIDMIPAYSPEARGRSERAFGTHQGRLPRELVLAGITDMESAFVPMADPERLDDILCEVHERTVGRDNCVSFAGMSPRLPGDRHRPHYMKARVRVRRHMDGHLSVWHGPRLLQRYSPDGRPGENETREVA